MDVTTERLNKITELFDNGKLGLQNFLVKGNTNAGKRIRASTTRNTRRARKKSHGGKVLVLVSSGHGLPLKDGKVYAGAGYYLNELTISCSYCSEGCLRGMYSTTCAL